MRVDVIDILRLESGVLNGVAHDPIAAIPVFRRRGDMMGVAAHPVSHHLGQNPGAPAPRRLQFFEDQHTRAFSHHESVAILVPGPAGVLRVLVPRRKRPHRPESADPHGSNAGFGSAANHGIGVTVLYQAIRIANGVSPGGAGRGRRRIRTFGSDPNRDVSGSHIDDDPGNEKWRNAARAVGKIGLVLPLDHVEAADSAADANAGALFLALVDFKSGTRERAFGRRDGELDEAPHLLDFFFLDIDARLESLDLPGDLGRETRHIERLNPGNSGPPLPKRRPRFLGAHCQR